MTKNDELTITEIVSMLTEAPTCEGIPLGVSNRHIHLSQEALEILFGAGYRLNKLKDLGQPGQFAARETVCIAGRKGCFPNVRVLGPVRPASQVEISRSDAFYLGVEPPVKVSGDLRGAADICVIGPAGMLVLAESVIIAKPHIHMTPKDAAFYQVADGQQVSVNVTGVRSLTIHEVAIRVTADSALEFHLDTDEANAAGVGSGVRVTI